MDPDTLRILNRFIFAQKPPTVLGIPAPTFHSSPEVQKLEIDNFRDWIAKHATGSDLPIYKLAQEGPELNLGSGGLSLSQPSYSSQRMSTSGLWRVFVQAPAGMGFEAASASGFDAIRDAGLSVDQRAEAPQAGVDSSLIVRTVRSRLAAHGLPVLGPGGHITAYRHRTQLEVDVVVRKRTGTLTASPRSADDIADSFGRRIVALSPPGGPAPQLWGGFGYFELSKYERQHYMRPAFVVTVSFPDDRGATLFNSILVEPASISPDVLGTEGLGSWSI